MSFVKQFPAYDKSQGTLDVTFKLPPQLMDNLRDFGSRKVKNATRSALGQAATIIKRSAEGQTPVYSGILKRSLGKKDSKHTAKSIYSLVGARRSFQGPKVPMNRQRRAKRQMKGAQGPVFYKELIGRKNQVAKPSKYLHLVEKGWTHYKTGKRIPGKHMLRNATTSSRGAVLSKIREVLTEKLHAAGSSQEIPTT